MKISNLVFGLVLSIGLSGCQFNFEAFLAGFRYQSPEKNQNSEISSTKSPSSDTDQLAIEQQAQRIIDGQQSLYDLYQTDFESLEGHNKRLLFMNLMTPLGVFDPFENPQKTVNVKALSNFLYGYRAKTFNLSSQESSFIVNATISYGEKTFDGSDFYQNNQSSLESIVKEMTDLQDIFLISDYGNMIIRINNYFSDVSKHKTWSLPIGSDNFYDYSQLNFELSQNDKDLLSSLTSKSQRLHQLMVDNDIETIYRCNEKMILIMAGSANNACGYVYNAQQPEEVNCGALSDRFRISKKIQVSDKWIYWAGK